MFYKIVVNFNGFNLSKCTNVFFMEDGALPSTDAVKIGAAENWLDAIYGAVNTWADTNYTLMDATLYEVDGAGQVVRIVGGLNPSIDGQLGGEGLSLTTAGSGSARTNIPRVRGSKRFGGIGEIVQADGLFTNAILSALAQAVLEWLLGATSTSGVNFPGGVISTAAETFVPFNDSGLVTNIPGTQVTRKPGRGT